MGGLDKIEISRAREFLDFQNGKTPPQVSDRVSIETLQPSRTTAEHRTPTGPAGTAERIVKGTDPGEDPADGSQLVTFDFLIH